MPSGDRSIGTSASTTSTWRWRRWQPMASDWSTSVRSFLFSVCARRSGSESHLKELGDEESRTEGPSFHVPHPHTSFFLYSLNSAPNIAILLPIFLPHSSLPVPHSSLLFSFFSSPPRTLPYILPFSPNLSTSTFYRFLLHAHYHPYFSKGKLCPGLYARYITLDITCVILRTRVVNLKRIS